MSRLWVLVALLGSVAAAKAADAYKWVDANGVMHYSDTAPAPPIQSELVHLRGTGGAAAPAALEDDTADTEGATGAPKKPSDTLVSSVMSAEKRCADARANLEVLQRNGPVGVDTGGKGQPKPLDEKERQRQLFGAQSIIATYCK